MTHSDSAGMEKVSKSVVRKCCIVSSAWYAMKCCTSCGSCILAYLISIIRVTPCQIPSRLRESQGSAFPLGGSRESISS